MQSTNYTQGGSSNNRFSKRGDSFSPPHGEYAASQANLKRTNLASIGTRSTVPNTRVMSSKGPRNNILNARSNSRIALGSNSNAYGMNVGRGTPNKLQNAEVKRPKSSGTYGKKMKYKQWGQQANMRSNNQLDFNNFNTQSRPKLGQASLSRPLTLNKEISEVSIQIGTVKNPRPRTSALNRSFN